MLVVVAVAVVDAVVGGSGTPDNASPAALTVADAGRDAAVARLRQAGIHGRLVYSDRRCVLHTVLLPNLHEYPPPAGPEVGCEFELSARGNIVAPRGAAVGGSRLVAACEGTVVLVLAPEEPQLSFDGCMPAWRPTSTREQVPPNNELLWAVDGPPGSLTLVRDGEVVAVGPGCAGQRRCGRVVLTAAAIRVAATNTIPPASQSALRRVRIHDVTWLSPTRVAVILRIPTAEDRVSHYLLAIFEAGRLRSTYPIADAIRDELVAELVAGPLGQRLWAGGDAVFTSDGLRLPIPNRFGRSRAAAWSPDEQWLALAAGDTIAFVRPGVDEPVLTVPIDAADLAWR